MTLELVSGERVCSIASADEMERLAAHGFATPVAADVLGRIVGFAQMFRNEGEAALTTRDLFADPPQRAEVSA